MSVFGCDSSRFSRGKISANCCQKSNFVNVYSREKHPIHGNQESAEKFGGDNLLSFESNRLATGRICSVGENIPW